MVVGAHKLHGKCTTRQAHTQQAPPSRPYRGEASYTRPDVAYAVGYLCRAMAKPTPELQACAERVLMYLGRTRELGLRFERSDTRLHADDSIWLQCCVIMYCNVLIYTIDTYYMTADAQSIRGGLPKEHGSLS